jgi:hypothetical protein
VNRLGCRLCITDREHALDFTYIQFNHPLIRRWLIFDVDGEDAYTRAEDRQCPPPTFIALNPENGHGHLGYVLSTPVTAFASSSQKALRFCEDVERGMIRRLGADFAYSGFLAKNPLSQQWKTDWQAETPYDLGRLNDCLDKADKRKFPQGEIFGVGRNLTLFDRVRKIAYRRCRASKITGAHSQFEKELQEAAIMENAHFPMPLHRAEVLGIVRSVVKWTWKHFTAERFSKIQSARSRKRWGDHNPLHQLKPWEQLGISRATWFRHRSS